jgi:uncharacterized protein (TIGR02217 family)
MTTFIEDRLPTTIRANLRGGPRYMTEIVETRGGQEQRNSLRSRPRRQWEFEYVQTRADLDALYQFWMAVQGAGIGFRFKDFFDYTATVADGILGTGVGTGAPTYQLGKRYLVGSLIHDESITKPVASTAVLYRSGAQIDTSPTEYTLDGTTGIVTFLADASEAITGHVVGAQHQFTTASDLGLAVNDYVYLTGVTGDDALLNSIAHEIVGKSGSGPYTWTIDTDTSGSPTLSPSGGTAYAYPQADETLTWAGEFDRPVRFLSDEFNFEYLSAQTWVQLSGVSVIELLP